MIEILVALAVFAIISAAAFQLFGNHARVFSVQQDLAGVNLSLRNALTMIQLDVSNAGTGVFVGANVPSWPIGVTVQNSVAGGGGGGSCFDPATQTYTAACFDIMHVVAADPNVPPVHPTDIGTNCVSTTSSTAFVNPATSPPPGLTAAQTAALFAAGDQLLFVKGDGSLMTSVVLSQDGQVAGNKVQLQHNPTAADGTGGDPLFITNNPNNKLGTTFCDNDWVIKLRPVTYRVNAANPDNPVLERVVSGVADVVADQIIGFKVGATLWNGGTSTEPYNYDAASYNTDGVLGSSAFDYTLIRSIRISLIGRTRPNPDPTYTFRNTFDDGRYQILGASMVVNPRNLSMRD